ncbi:hypothetical protein RHEC894_PE00506 (plasmid) [Rhizobium sp. CIAT894]|nr:hypothetical protein RHEC894_PE00506 [Rhizobium sp. CIAT894]
MTTSTGPRPLSNVIRTICHPAVPGDTCWCWYVERSRRCFRQWQFAWCAVKVGRVRTCKLGKRGLKAEAEWIEAHRKLFEARFEALDEIISEMKREGNDESAS